MFDNVKTILKGIVPDSTELSSDEEEFLPHLTYSSVPYTLTMRKRQFEEEQYSKYSIHKEKLCDIK